MSADGGGGIPIIGGIMGAGGALMEASDKKSAYESEAWDLERNANLNRKMGEYNVMRQQIAAGKKFGAMEADYAASGVASDSGSVSAVIKGSHINAELDRQNIVHGVNVRSMMMEERAQTAHRAGDRAEQMGYYNAFSSIFGGAAKSGMMSGGGKKGGDDMDFSADEGYGSAGGSYSDGGSYA